jgi:multidrug efflux pump
VLGSIYFLYTSAKSELAPTEDQGVIITSIDRGAERDAAAAQLIRGRSTRSSRQHPETEHVFQLDVPGQSIAGMVFKPWDQRTQDHQPDAAAGECSRNCQQRSPALRIVAFQPPPLPGSFGLPVQFVIVTTEPFERAQRRSSQQFLQEALAERHVHLPRQRSEIDNPQSTVVIDRDKTAQLGIEDERRRQLADRRCSAAAMSIISA